MNEFSIEKGGGHEPLLPKIKPEIRSALQAEILQDPAYLEKMILKLKTDNPQVLDFLNSFIANEPDKKQKLQMLYSGILVYRMLESQKQADAMKRQFNKQ